MKHVFLTFVLGFLAVTSTAYAEDDATSLMTKICKPGTTDCLTQPLSPMQSLCSGKGFCNLKRSIELVNLVPSNNASGYCDLQKPTGNIPYAEQWQLLFNPSGTCIMVNPEQRDLALQKICDEQGYCEIQ